MLEIAVSHTHYWNFLQLGYTKTNITLLWHVSLRIVVIFTQFFPRKPYMKVLPKKVSTREKVGQLQPSFWYLGGRYDYLVILSTCAKSQFLYNPTLFPGLNNVRNFSYVSHLIVLSLSYDLIHNITMTSHSHSLYETTPLPQSIAALKIEQLLSTYITRPWLHPLRLMKVIQRLHVPQQGYSIRCISDASERRLDFL